jgi:aminopeptidase-like protein
MNSMDLRPDTNSQAAMWNLISELFPKYRTLCGPGYRASLDAINMVIPLDIIQIPSGTEINGWFIPKEFSVREAWIADSRGKKIIDFAEHPYHLRVYSQPFDGIVDLATILEKIAVSDESPTAIPLRQCYYKSDWGFCATKAQRDALNDSHYHVFIDVEHRKGNLSLGECYLPGRSEKEIVFTAYLCHPHGANDNLSGVVVAVELMKLLSQIPVREYSYRLLLNPETIGSLAWIHSDRRRIEHVIGGYEISICGDPSPVRYFESVSGDSLVDRAGLYALTASNLAAAPIQYSFVDSGCDQSQFNAPGVHISFGRWARAGASNYAEYHTSADNLDLVRSDVLLETLSVICKAVSAIERNFTFKPLYKGLPFLSGLGVYPYRHYSGDGSVAVNDLARAYYELLGFVDGQNDMLDIARRTKLPIEAFDEAVADFLRVGLIERVS